MYFTLAIPVNDTEANLRKSNFVKESIQGLEPDHRIMSLEYDSIRLKLEIYFVYNTTNDTTVHQLISSNNDLRHNVCQPCITDYALWCLRSGI